MIYVELMMIQIAVVCIVDVAQFPQTVLAFVGRLLRFPLRTLRPFTCSLCLTFWACLAYVIVTHNLSVYTLAASLVLASFADIVAEVIYTAKDLVRRFINHISNTKQK